MTDDTQDADASENDGESAASDSTGEIEIEVTRGGEDPRRDERDDPADRDDLTNRNQSDGGPTGLDAGEASEHRLADELGRIDIMTTPDGYVEGRVTDVTAVDATTVRLTVSLPHGETTSFELEKPIPWSEEFLLARIVEDVGYDAASIDHVVGESVYLARTDVGSEAAGDDDWGWWTTSVQAASDALLSSLSGGRYRIETNAEPEWRLVDPLERPDATPEADATETTSELVGTGLILVGTVVAAAGAVFGATGALVVSSSIVAYALVGLLLVLTGIVVLLDRDRSVL